jgi:hypothetical protein
MVIRVVFSEFRAASGAPIDDLTLEALLEVREMLRAIVTRVIRRS